MPEPLTDVERKVYHYLVDFLTENTYQPSVREIGRRFQIKSTKTVSELLQRLADKGYIERDPSRSRGVRLLGYAGATRTQPVPFYGRIHAGEPSLLPEHREGFITVDRRFLPCEDAFFLRVKGDSMTGRGIFDGDYVMICPGATAADGQVIAARLGEEAAIKIYRPRGDRVVLEPANAAHERIIVRRGDDFGILGLVCGVFRPYQDKPAGPMPAMVS